MFKSHAFLFGYLNKIAREANISYSCAMLYLEDADSNALKRWNEDMKKIDIAEDDLHEFGIEENPHITVLYGIHTGSVDKVIGALRGNERDVITARLDGGLGIFENDKYDVLYRGVDRNDHLHEIRDHLLDNVKATVTYPKYTPHATVAYLKKGRAKKYIEKCKGMEFSLRGEFGCDVLHFSDKGSKHYKIDLQNLTNKEAGQKKNWKDHYKGEPPQCATKKCKKKAEEAVQWADGRGRTAMCNKCMKQWEYNKGKKDREIVSRIKLPINEDTSMTKTANSQDEYLTAIDGHVDRLGIEPMWMDEDGGNAGWIESIGHDNVMAIDGLMKADGWGRDKHARDENVKLTHLPKDKKPYRQRAEVLAFDPDKGEIVARVKRSPVGGLYLELPGGGIDEGETPAIAVKREAMEEAGITLTNVEQVGRCKWRWPKKHQEAMGTWADLYAGDDTFLFIATVTSAGKPTSEEGDGWEKLKYKSVDALRTFLKTHRKDGTMIMQDCRLAALRKLEARQVPSGIAKQAFLLGYLDKAAAVSIDLEIGDIVLTGRYKNKRTVVKELGTDELGMPTMNGQKLLALRIEKLLPKKMWTSKTLAEDSE